MDTWIIISCIVVLMLTVILIFINRKRINKKQFTDTPSSPNVEKQEKPEEPELLVEPQPKDDLNPIDDTIEIVGYIKTTGQDEYYKKKLLDQKWLDKVKEIKHRDGYQCQHCFGLTLLDKIEDIRNYVDYPEVGDIVIDIFKNKELYCKESSHTYKVHTCNVNAGLYVSALIDIKCLRDTGRLDLLTMSPLNDESVCGRSTNTYTQDYFRYNVNDPSKKTNTIGIIYFAAGNTNDQLILRNIDGYKNNLPYAKQGVLTFNGLSIVFPLLTIKKECLEVHHLAYYENLEPWDPKNELITLCHKCHMKAHQQEIPVKIYISSD